jgi:hypothetical protein
VVLLDAFAIVGTEGGEKACCFRGLVPSLIMVLSLAGRVQIVLIAVDEVGAVFYVRLSLPLQPCPYVGQTFPGLQRWST